MAIGLLFPRLRKATFFLVMTGAARASACRIHRRSLTWRTARTRTPMAMMLARTCRHLFHSPRSRSWRAAVARRFREANCAPPDAGERTGRRPAFPSCSF